MPYRGSSPPLDGGGGQLGGFFSKMKNKIFEGAAAITGAEHMQPPSNEQRRPVGPPQYSNYQSSRGSRSPGAGRAPPGPGMGRQTGIYGPPSSTSGPQSDSHQHEGGNFWGKLKGFFSDGEDEQLHARPQERKSPVYGSGGGRPGAGPRGYSTHGSIPPSSAPSHFGHTSPEGDGATANVFPSSQSSQFGTGTSWGDLSQDPYGASPPPPPPPLFPDEPVVQDIPSQYVNQQGFYPPQASPFDEFGAMSSADPVFPPHSQGANDGSHNPYSPDSSFGSFGSFENDSYMGHGGPPPMEQSPIPAEPQIFVVEDCIVLIPRPVEFYGKKTEFAQSGPQNLQVFTDYERCLTRFRTDEGMKSMGTAELLESSTVLMPVALEKIKTVIDSFAEMGPEGATYDSEENFTVMTPRFMYISVLFVCVCYG